MNLNNQRWLKDLSVSSMEMGESELGFSSNAGDSSICLNFFLYFFKRKLIEHKQPMMLRTLFAFLPTTKKRCLQHFDTLCSFQF